MQPSRRNEHWRDLTTTLREQIAAIRTPSGSKPAAASRALQTLSELESEIDQRLIEESDARRRRIIGPRARVRAVIYKVEDSPRGPALTERRDSDARPFKCPKPIYDAVAVAVGASPEPQTFLAIKELAEHRFDEPLADYAVRTPLRFWSLLGLIHHEQARFTRVGTKAAFMKKARDHWKKSMLDAVQSFPS